jgi:hypothetical protein
VRFGASISSVIVIVEPPPPLLLLLPRRKVRAAHAIRQLLEQRGLRRTDPGGRVPEAVGMHAKQEGPSKPGQVRRSRSRRCHDDG